MILDKCKNCKHYEPDERNFKEFFSSKPKIKYLDKGYCLYFYKTVKSDAWWTINLYRKETKSNGWCERYERKEERRTKNEFTD